MDTLSESTSTSSQGQGRPSCQIKYQGHRSNCLNRRVQTNRQMDGRYHTYHSFAINKYICYANSVQDNGRCAYFNARLHFVLELIFYDISHLSKYNIGIFNVLFHLQLDFSPYFMNYWAPKIRTNQEKTDHLRWFYMRNWPKWQNLKSRKWPIQEITVVLQLVKNNKQSALPSILPFFCWPSCCVIA